MPRKYLKNASIRDKLRHLHVLIGVAAPLIRDIIESNELWQDSPKGCARLSKAGSWAAKPFCDRRRRAHSFRVPTRCGPHTPPPPFKPTAPTSPTLPPLPPSIGGHHPPSIPHNLFFIFFVFFFLFLKCSLLFVFPIDFCFFWRFFGLIRAGFSQKIRCLIFCLFFWWGRGITVSKLDSYSRVSPFWFFLPFFKFSFLLVLLLFFLIGGGGSWLRILGIFVCVL